MKTILVTGGAGYVGSQSVLHFRDLGWRAVVLDDLSTGQESFLGLADRFVEGHAGDLGLTSAVLASEAFDGVLHCAGKALVPESMRRPLFYYRENVGTSAAVFEAAAAAGLPVVFSSSCAVYGQPDEVPIHEETPARPVNPYGHSKRVAEQALEAAGLAQGLSWVALRYFNAAGADPKGRVGERDRSRSRVVPNLLRDGPNGEFTLFGDAWPTRDGSPEREFVHTLDIARAHAAAFEHLWAGGESGRFNLGGCGATVLELVAEAERVMGCRISVRVVAPRAGDPARLLADRSRAEAVLGWVPQYSSLPTILETAWRWTEADPWQRASVS